MALSKGEKYVYLANNNFGLKVIDISNKNEWNVASPAILKVVAQFIIINGGHAYGVTLSFNENYLFLAYWEKGLNVIDISNKGDWNAISPTNLKIVARIITDGFASKITLSADEQYAFVSDYHKGLKVINIQN